MQKAKTTPRWLGIVLLAALSLGLVLSSAQAQTVNPELQEKVRRANAECFACHSEEGLRNPPRADMDLARLKATLRDMDHFLASNHGGMDCRQCHGQAAIQYPHPTDLAAKISPCEECHAVKVMRVEKQFFASVHGKNLQDSFSCLSCHDVHRDAVAKKLGDPAKIVAQDNHMCLECHNSDLAFAKVAPEGKKRPDLDRIHHWLPNARRHWEAVRCVDCHTPAAKTQSHEIVGKDKAERNCVACHSAQTSLMTRLYRHMAEDDQQRFGFVNSAVLANSYVVGATRNPILDAAILGIGALTVLGVLGHGAVRILLALRRRRQK